MVLVMMVSEALEAIALAYTVTTNSLERVTGVTSSVGVLNTTLSHNEKFKHTYIHA